MLPLTAATRCALAEDRERRVAPAVAGCTDRRVDARPELRSRCLGRQPRRPQGRDVGHAHVGRVRGGGPAERNTHLGGGAEGAGTAEGLVGEAASSSSRPRMMRGHATLLRWCPRRGAEGDGGGRRREKRHRGHAARGRRGRGLVRSTRGRRRERRQMARGAMCFWVGLGEP